MTAGNPEGEPPSRMMFWLAVWSIALFAACLALDTRDNGFPYFYHPDESEKASQVITGRWNFHHPMLLLTATKVAVDTLGIGKSEQPVVETGRWVSATFTAAAVVAFSLLAFTWRGWTASFTAGIALLLHHQLFELSHYMKEDTALLAGLALTFLAAFAFLRTPNAWTAAILGFATALAISGKYVGAAALAVAIPVLWRTPREQRAKWLGSFAAALVVVLVLVNLPLLLDLGSFQRSFGREMDFVVHGQRGTTRSVPHTLYWNSFRDNSTPVVWVLLVVFLAARWRERRSVRLVEWIVIGFPFAYTLALSFSPKTNDRYFLPAAATFTFLAALGALDVARWMSLRLPLRWALTIPAATLAAAQLPSLLAYSRAFSRDDNAEMLAWIRANLPASAVIAKDSRIQLPDPDNKHDALRFASMPQKILADKYAADIGTIDQLREKGVTHVAVSESDYGKFFLRGLRPQKGEGDSFARRRAFYESLLRDNVPLFTRDRGPVLYLHPGIRIYTLPPLLD
jgi:hypothetical protein